MGSVIKGGLCPSNHSTKALPVQRAFLYVTHKYPRLLKRLPAALEEFDYWKRMKIETGLKRCPNYVCGHYCPGTYGLRYARPSSLT